MVDRFNTRFEELNGEYSSNGFEIIQASKGPWTHEDVEGFAYELEEMLPEKGVKKGIIKRIFSLIIEALQNIRLHGGKDDSGEQTCFYFIAKNDELFKIMTANIIHKDVIEKVQTRIDKINTLDRAGLKEFYMDTLTDGQRSSKGGAGLGFITVAMKAKSNIDYTFDALNDEYYKFEMFCDMKLKKEEN
ncbi:DUF6272 family protein [Flavobacteriales bacterium]|nr:DUF6272 family protein [Flavobacteriales bacterium]